MSTCDEPTCRRRSCQNRVLHAAPHGLPLDEDDTDLGLGYECPECFDWYPDGSPFIVWMPLMTPREVQSWST